MKLKENFLLRQVADTWVVVPVGQDMLDFNGMINLNETGALLWKQLEAGADLDALVKVLTGEYDVPENVARVDIVEFLNKLQKAGCLEI